jgi:hypothetical protein
VLRCFASGLCHSEKSGRKTQNGAPTERGVPDPSLVLGMREKIIQYTTPKAQIPLLCIIMIHSEIRKEDPERGTGLNQERGPIKTVPPLIPNAGPDLGSL